MRDDDACLRSTRRPTATPRYHLAVGHNRARGMPGLDFLVVHDLGFPSELARNGIDGIHVAVIAGVDDHIPVDGHVPVDRDEATQDLGGILWYLAAVLPLEIAGHRIDRLKHVVRIRHIEHSAIRQWRSLLAASSQAPGPHQLQIIYVVASDLVERAVAPPVQGSSPHEPVTRCRGPATWRR